MRFPTNRGLFRQNDRISGIILRGFYATNERTQRNHNDDGKEEISKTKSLNLQHFFLAGFFAFIARPTLSNFIEKVMRLSL